MSARYKLTCPDCGHVTTSRTPGNARRGMAGHSCATTAARRAKTARAAARRADPGTPAPCTHIDTDGTERHPHGNRIRYIIDRCRCRACRDASRAYEANRLRRKAYGLGTLTGYVDAQPVRDHIQALSDQGMGWKRVARDAGIAPSTVCYIRYGRSGGQPKRRVMRRTADKILAVRYNPGDWSIVDGNGTRLRLQALTANGWPRAQLTARLGSGPDNWNRLLTGHGKVRASTRDAVTRVYEQLWDAVPVPAGPRETAQVTLARRRAAARGWARPMELDDDLVDDPGYVPTRVDEPPRGRGQATDNVENIEWLADHGLTLHEIVTQLQLHPDSITRSLKAAGRGDLIQRIRRNQGRGDTTGLAS